MGLDVSTPAIVTMRQHVILLMENVIAGLASVEIGEKHYEFTIFDIGSIPQKKLRNLRHTSNHR